MQREWLLKITAVFLSRNKDDGTSQRVVFFFPCACCHENLRRQAALTNGLPCRDAGATLDLMDTGDASPSQHKVTHLVMHFLVKGRVQGVGFRWFVHREAAELGLRGWVRNLDSGEVELVAAGEPEALDELKQSLRQGSRGSRVDQLIEHELAETEAADLKDFKIEGAW